MSDCEVKTTKKYTTRKGPPRGANEEGCRGQQMLGNDGCMYESVPDKNGTYKWKSLNYCVVPPAESFVEVSVAEMAVAKPKKKKAAKKAKKVSKKVEVAEPSEEPEEEEEVVHAGSVADFDEMVSEMAAAKPKKRTKQSSVKKAAKKASKKASKKMASPPASPSKAPAGRKKAAPKKAKSAVKRALSAYMFFSAESQKKYAKDVPIAQRGAEIGAAWRALTNAQKKPYETLAAKDKARAERERAALSK